MSFARLIASASRLRRWPKAARYGITVALVAATLGLQLWLEGFLSGLRFVLFFPTIIAVSLAFGGGAGFAATALAALGTLYFFIEPFLSLDIDDIAAVGLFLVFLASGAFTAAIVETLQSVIERLGRSEAEKVLLLDELGHRTKNNLQMISALLAMQARDLTDATARRALDAAVGRVAAMGKAHQRLHRRDAATVVDAGSFVEELCTELERSLIGPRPIALTVAVAPMELELGRAVSVGLIINELLTNALKYAFPDGRPGTVSVRLEPDGAGWCRLEVRDDGVGIDPTLAPGLGSRLVRLMAERLGGAVEVSAEGGTRTVVRFKAPAVG